MKSHHMELPCTCLILASYFWNNNFVPAAHIAFNLRRPSNTLIIIPTHHNNYRGPPSETKKLRGESTKIKFLDNMRTNIRNAFY